MARRIIFSFLIHKLWRSALAPEKDRSDSHNSSLREVTCMREVSHEAFQVMNSTTKSKKIKENQRKSKEIHAQSNGFLPKCFRNLENPSQIFKILRYCSRFLENLENLDNFLQDLANLDNFLQDLAGRAQNLPGHPASYKYTGAPKFRFPGHGIR